MKSNSKDLIKVSLPKNYLYQEDYLYQLPIITNKGKINQKLNDIDINKVGKFINIPDEDLVVKGKLLDSITP